MVGINEVIEQNKYLNFKKNNFRVLADKTIKLIWFQYLILIQLLQFFEILLEIQSLN
jgi:hypothetical protein